MTLKHSPRKLPRLAAALALAMASPLAPFVAPVLAQESAPAKVQKVQPADVQREEAQFEEAQLQVVIEQVDVDVDVEKAAPRVAKAKAVRVLHAKNWLGVYTEPAGEDLRAQLDLDGRGIVVRQVQPESPAAQAGVKVHDVLIEAGGKSLRQVDDLQAAVKETGEKPLEVTLLRGGKKTSVKVQPAVRPQEFEVEVSPVEAETHKAQKALEHALKAFQEQAEREGNRTWQFRAFGPGVMKAPDDKVVVHGFNFSGPVGGLELPKGVSIQINKEGAEPAKVTIKKEGKSWETTADRLEAIPEDLRPHVARMLGSAGERVTVRLDEHLPGEVRERIMKKLPGGAPGTFTVQIAPPGGPGGPTILGGTGGATTAGSGGLIGQPGVKLPSGAVAISGTRVDDASGIKAELSRLREEVSQLRKEMNGRNSEREAIHSLLKKLLDETKK